MCTIYIYIIKKKNNIEIKNILTQYPVQIRSLGTFLMGGEPLTRPRRVYCVSGRDLKNKYLYIQKINIYICKLYWDNFQFLFNISFYFKSLRI